MSQTVFGRHSDSIERRCSRCHKELTDAASREAGVGPICRAKNNDIFSRMIPANLGIATALFLNLDGSRFNEEIQEDFDSLRKTYLHQMQKAQQKNEDAMAVKVDGGDFRKVVDWLDFSLSYPSSHEHRIEIIKIIEALGYIALGSVLRGDACMSPAKLYVDGDQICLEGKSQKRGYYEMRRNIVGIETPRYRGDKRPYKASVLYAEKFVEIAVTHWPFIEDNVDKVLKQARKVAKKVEKELKKAKKNKKDTRPVATFEYGEIGREVGVSVNFPWIGSKPNMSRNEVYREMMNMINAIKEIPYKDRRYDRNTKSWVVRKRYFESVKKIV
jgi:hypothetical protein